MKTSKIAVFHGPGRPLTIETASVPVLRDGEILVRNEYATLCRSDLHTFSGKRTERTPTILGHETVGIIEELAPGAPTRDGRGAELRVGDRVTWGIYASDPSSRMARLGLPQKAPGLFKYGHEQITPESTLHGGLAEHCILRRHTPVVRVEGPPPLLALINCSVATAAGSLRLAGSVRDQNVVIAGAGTLGVIACAMCQGAGARRIVAVDIDDGRLAAAKEFGADFTVNLRAGGSTSEEKIGALIPGETAQVVLDYSGVPESMEALVGLLGVGGVAVFVGATCPQRPLQINAEQLIRKMHTIKGLHNYNEADLIAAVGFMEQNFWRPAFANLVHDRFDLDSVNEAFQYGIESGAHRVGVRIGTGASVSPPNQ